MKIISKLIFITSYILLNIVDANYAEARISFAGKWSLKADCPDGQTITGLANLRASSANVRDEYSIQYSNSLNQVADGLALFDGKILTVKLDWSWALKTQAYFEVSRSNTYGQPIRL